MAKSPQTTVTLKQLATKLAEQHDLPKTTANALLSDLVSQIGRHLKKGERVPNSGARNSDRPQARRTHGPQSGNGRGDQDQGQQEGRLPSGQGVERVDLT